VAGHQRQLHVRLVLLAQSHHAIPVLLYGIATAALLAALVLTGMNLELPRKQRNLAESVKVSASGIGAIALGGLFFLYVGTENSVSGWVAALTRRMAAAPKDLWTLAPMFFWGGLLAGRALVPINPLRKREKLFVQAGLMVGLAGSTILLVVSTFAGVAACVAFTGFGFAAIYPVLIAWMAKYFGERASDSAISCSRWPAWGEATMPLLVGFVSTREGNLKTGLIVPAASCAVMLGLLLWVPRKVAA